MHIADLVQSLQEMAREGLKVTTGLKALGANVDPALVEALYALESTTEALVEMDFAKVGRENEELRKKLEVAYDTLDGWAEDLEERAGYMRSDLPVDRRRRHG